MKFRLANLLAGTALLISFGIVLLIAYWQLCPVKAIAFNDEILPVLNEKHEIKSGGYLEIKIDYCKYSNVIPEITRTFQDGILYAIPPVLATEKTIGCKIETVYVYVPKALPEGTYLLKNTYRYKVNPIRNIDITVDTEKFTIIK